MCCGREAERNREGNGHQHYMYLYCSYSTQWHAGLPCLRYAGLPCHRHAIGMNIHVARK